MTLMFLLGIDLGVHVLPWTSPTVVSLLVLSFLTIGLFYWSEKNAKYPLIPLRLFHNLSNVASLVVNFTQAFVYMAAEYYLPLYLQSAKEASPTRSGLLIFPLTLVQALAAITSGTLIHRTGEYCFILYAGMLLVTIGNGLYITLQSDTSTSMIIGMEILAGIGIGLTFAPPLISIHANVPEKDVSTATSTFGYIHNLSTAMATVIGSAVIQAGMGTQAARLEAVGLPLQLIEAFVGRKATSNVEMIREVGDVGQKAAVKDAFTSSLRNLWILCTILSAIGLLATALISRRRLPRSEQAPETAGNEPSEASRAGEQ
ncbi:putative MFS transporter [Neofusicoccum parvum]|nr:putative MFS transporter [Neofusicoccum parvum]